MKRTADETQIMILKRRVTVLERALTAHKEIVDKALDKLRKALPHVNFED